MALQKSMTKAMSAIKNREFCFFLFVKSQNHAKF